MARRSIILQDSRAQRRCFMSFQVEDEIDTYARLNSPKTVLPNSRHTPTPNQTTTAPRFVSASTSLSSSFRTHSISVVSPITTVLIVVLLKSRRVGGREASPAKLALSENCKLCSMGDQLSATMTMMSTGYIAYPRCQPACCVHTVLADDFYLRSQG